MFSSKNKFDNLISLPGFQIDEIKKNADQKVFIQAHSVNKSGICPSCNTTSNRVHSTYLRFPQSLPILGMQTHFHLKVNRFFCDNDQCSKRTFAEQVKKIVPRYARRSVELNYVLTGLSFEASAEAVARICSRLQIKISPDSVLRFLRTISMPSNHSDLRIVGVDDWAFKKGQRYGTILVDLETHRPIELLPDRTAETLARWLALHPEIKIVARDRSKEYRVGIETGAPNAIQIADRWHLLHNLRERVQSVLPSALRTVRTPQPTTAAGQKRQKYFEMVRYLYARGYPKRAIARALGINRGTVKSYIDRETLPDYHKGVPRPSKIDRYKNYLRKRWNQGCRDVTQLWKEIQSLGYKNQRKSVYRYLKRFRSGEQYLSICQLTWLFIRSSAKLLDEENVSLNQLLSESKEIENLYCLV